MPIAVCFLFCSRVCSESVMRFRQVMFLLLIYKMILTFIFQRIKSEKKMPGSFILSSRWAIL